MAIEKEGSVYSCDHFGYPEYRLGNLQENRLADMALSAQQQKFGCDKYDTLPDYCKRCQYNFACNGECPKNRFLKTPDGEPGLNYLCSGIRRFLALADPYFRRIVDRLQGQHRGRTGHGADKSGTGSLISAEAGMPGNLS